MIDLDHNEQFTLCKSNCVFRFFPQSPEDVYRCIAHCLIEKPYYENSVEDVIDPIPGPIVRQAIARKVGKEVMTCKRRARRYTCESMDLETVPDNITDADIDELDLSHNNIRLIRKSMFRKLRRISELILSLNLIEEIEPDAFSHMKNLKLLDVSYNPLKEVNLKLWLGNNKQLQTVSLSGIDMSNTLLPFIFRDFPNLRSISMRRCGLKQITVELFKDQDDIEYLDLAENQLRTFPVELVKKFVNLRYLMLYDNPITCDCSNYELKKIITQRNIQIDESSHITQCALPFELAKQAFSQLNDTIFTYCSEF
ncbi:uncharacterized protein B4U79_16198 [Dinothrombium tinctorium]|uniref:Uncharacterized protein n=1 Tax=Dinothrombium tinctorium TaxID=1965070 RepID=A0A3S3RVB2_9ACAR|nr:uncharacterized protein B4U79_16622 [Dinothrombium tinctorium]RWS03871.1 uncharacterized protein B4U79_16468 [Dinothrombium tinctorium]RWS06558.1 uncharacterized protein B4U79_16198 [Dinothrombium tinctorium]